MRIRLTGVWLQVACFSSTWAYGETLGWKQALAELAQNNAELKAAREQINAAQFSVDSAEAAFLPQVSASLDYDYGTNKSDLLAKGPGIAPSSSYGVGLSLVQSLYAGGGDEARVAKAKAEAESSRVNWDVVRARLSAELKTSYANLIYAQNAVLLQEDILRRRQENLRLVELRFESGRENKGSVLQSEAYLAQARLEALQARNGLTLAESQLRKLLGRSEGGLLRLAPDLPSAEPPQTPDFAALAQATNEARQARLQIDQAQASLRLARAGSYPTVSLSGQLLRRDESFFPQQESWSVGLSLNYPLYSGGKDSASILAAQASLQAAGWTQENLDKQLTSRLRQAHATWVEAVERQRVDESFAKAALVRADIARKKYDNGLTSFEDWDRIESELISRQRSLLASQRDRVTSEAGWEQLQGKGVIP
jgi:outer membrane protein TolC